MEQKNFFDKHMRTVVAVIATAVLSIVGTCAVVKGQRIFNKLELTPDEAAKIRKERILAEFEAWKAETKTVVAKALQEEKTKLKELGKIFLIPDFNKPLGPQIEERGAVYRQLKKDIMAAYSGAPMDFDGLRDEYMKMLISMEDEKLQRAITECLWPVQTVYLQLHKIDHLVDMKTQVDEFKNEMAKQAQKAIEDELPLLSRN